MKLWHTLVRPKHIFDLWDFRICFHNHFRNRPFFFILEDKDGIAGLLPLSFVEDLDMFVFFPGEIWQGKTWLERTPVYFRNEAYLHELLNACPERTYLRYMEVQGDNDFPELAVDEIGYVLYQELMHFDMAQYWKRFSRKKYKDIIKTVSRITGDSKAFHINRLEDFDHLVHMSLTNFGPNSYLYDDRFRKSLRDVVDFLNRRGFLRMVSLEIRGERAAIDMGALFGNIYTVFLGGTHPDFLGVAKVMNTKHMEFACMEGISKVDFLCGDFHWKKLWHLDPEPLYKFVTPELMAEQDTDFPVIYDVFRSLAPTSASLQR
jgi:hypothetical protein